MTQFKIGDRVNYPRFGDGVVKLISPSGAVGVVFDTEDAALHDLNGQCGRNRAWWVTSGDDSLTLIAPAKYADQPIVKLPLVDNTAPDNTNPDHYKRGGTETIDYLRAKMTDEEFKGFCRGNALKYISRAPDKNQDEDYRKAIWYLRMLIGDDPRKTK